MQLPIPLISSSGPYFLRLGTVVKMYKDQPKSSLRGLPITSLSALLIEFQKGHPDNKKYSQLLVKLMSCTLRETLMSSQRAAGSLSKARGKSVA